MTGSNLDAHAKIRRRYLRFAEHEARGISPLYDELARHVASSAPLLEFLAQLPLEKQQPNLLFGAVRLVCGVADGGSHFERLVQRNASQITRTMRNRRTQTNEPARCAVLLPAVVFQNPIWSTGDAPSPERDGVLAPYRSKTPSDPCGGPKIPSDPIYPDREGEQSNIRAPQAPMRTLYPLHPTNSEES